MRRIAILLLLLACKKPKKEEPPGPPPGPPKVGHSVTKVGSGEGGSGSGVAASDDGDAGVQLDARMVGGDGSPAHRDAQGRVHGPGGPVYMGRGAECDDKHDHCLRPDVWFSVANIVAGKLFRAVPVYQFEDKWWTWRGEEDTPTKLYKTKLADKAPAAGTPVIWFSTETSSGKWADSEYEALVSSRWEAGVVEGPGAPGSVRISGWGDATLDTVRVIVEQK